MSCEAQCRRHKSAEEPPSEGSCRARPAGKSGFGRACRRCRRILVSGQRETSLPAQPGCGRDTLDSAAPTGEIVNLVDMAVWSAILVVSVGQACRKWTR